MGHVLDHRILRRQGRSWPELCLGGNKIRKEKMSEERKEKRRPHHLNGHHFVMMPVLHQGVPETAVTLGAPRLRRNQLCIWKVKEGWPGVPCVSAGDWAGVLWEGVAFWSWASQERHCPVEVTRLATFTFH